ncbi:MAG: DUF2304 domain-containing protein, partial [Candidatus Aminicenantes bacterium]|nr:DUF2304 domain-containing protein [Candidatus Aminicenantes bacterium]
RKKMNPYPIGSMQILSIIGSLLLLVILITLIRKKKLSVEYALLWIAIFVMFLALSLFRGLIDVISGFLGINYQPASLFIVLILSLFLLSFHFSIIISGLKNKINKLVIQITLLENRLQEKQNTEDKRATD